MQKVQISAQTREEKENTKNLFKENILSGVAYDTKGNSRLIKISDTKTPNVLAKLSYSSIVELKIDDGKTEHALITEVQHEKRTNRPYHLSFLILQSDEIAKFHVELRVINESPAVKNNLGVLLTTLDSIEVKGKPGDIPEHISVDISKLMEVGDSIAVKDLEIPSGTELVRDEDKDLTVATIRPFQKIVEEVKPVEEATEEGTEGAKEESAEETPSEEITETPKK